jgi:signal transduction histidine kinase
LHRIGSGIRSALRRPTALVATLLVVLAAGGYLSIRAVHYWRDDIIRKNLSFTTAAAADLARRAEAQWRQWPVVGLSGDAPVVDLTPEDLDRSLKAIANGVFASGHALKGGFWVLQQDEFMGYADPWSPPPAPAFGPPPRSYPVILQQVRDTIAKGAPLIEVHEFDSVSVSRTVFTLATHPIRRDGRIVAVAWARIHIEQELPAAKLSRYLSLGALVTLVAFLAALLTTMFQRREIRSLNENLRLIERDPTLRLAQRKGMFGSIRCAINQVLGSLEEESRHRQALETQLHQQDKMAALGNLLAAVAHEIKTPLAIVKTRVQIWQRDLEQYSRENDVPPPLQNESMQLVLTEIDRLSGLLKKLLAFLRPVRRDLMQPVDISDLVRHTVLFARPRIVQRRVDLDLALAATDGQILGDADSLHQAFLNILTNSLDHVEEGGAIAIASRLDHDGRQVVLDFADNGPGLTPEVRARAFDPFFTTRHGGSGLGLSITYEIIKAHRGTIMFVDPDALGGARCRIFLPLNRAPGEET